MDKEKQVRDGFNSSSTYFKMMAEWHKSHGGVAVEDEVKIIIQDHCRDGDHILEAGCGEGSITLWFAAQYPHTSFFGVDISKIGIQMALVNSPANARFYVADLKQLSEQANSVDFIFSQSVLEHVVNWEESLREMYRVLKKGSELLIRVGNGGVRGKSLPAALRDYLLFNNQVRYVDSSFHLRDGDYHAHMTNFDVQEIPSDVLLHMLKTCGFNIRFFSTRTYLFRSGDSRGMHAVILWLLSHLNFWPFNHLGPTIIVLAQKD
jgi:ubiquinone/menaquinone biosynthesis C-methylase UbiE